MGYVFISYSSHNQVPADAMRELLCQNGIHTWMAPYDIPAGSKYAQVINQALRDCACLVLMLTNDAQCSTWVAKEVERAIHYKKTIIPLQLEDLVLNDEFEFYISTDQIVPVKRIDSNSEALQKVLRSICACIDQEVPVIFQSQAPSTVSFDVRAVRTFASCGKEGSVFKIKKAEDGQSISASVNFEKTRLRDEIPDFAGLYYLKNPAIDIRQCKSFRFEARSADRSISDIQVEIKPQGKAWMHESFVFSLTDTYEEICICTSDFTFPETLSCVEELTIVIKPEFFTDENCLQGTLEIRNIQIL